MARAGGFSGSLNPFGGGNLGGFSQYDIGADLADLEVYRVEVAWGNGLATDDEYLSALRKALDATDPDTQRRESAQNKLDDAVYRVGRSKAEGEGLDALIAFDLAALAKMTPDNVRYRTVKDSLDAEMAQRRSRDYGKLVDQYNAGKTTTQTLLTWAEQALAGLDEDAPDFDSWTGVVSDLEERIRDEADQAMYQSYEQGRIKGDALLAHITARRDQFDPGTPKWEDWNRRLEDATDNVNDKAQAEKDAAFFNRYELGKVSDKSYLKYLRDRIAAMEEGDPQRREWQHRLNQAAFSLAEDQLRFDVERGKAPVSRLVSFYRNYRATLNPGSAEWRQITRALDNLAGYGGGRSGGGGGGGRTSAGGSGGGTAGAGSAIGPGPALTVTGTGPVKPGMASSINKVISPKYSLTNVLGLFSIDPSAKKSAISAAKKYLDLNMQTLGNAVRAGDAVWLFHDPRKPGASVPGKNPDGSPMLDRNGKPVMVAGSAYLPASNEAYANLLTVQASNWQAAAGYALSKGTTGDYAYALKRASESLDQARTADAQARAQDWDGWYESTQNAVSLLTSQGEYAQAASMGLDLARRLAAEGANPNLDDTRREKLDSLGEKLAANPLIPKVTPDGRVIEGALNMALLQRGEAVLNPGWHHVLKADKYGRPDYGPVYDERQDGSWEQRYVAVQTVVGGKVVTGEVERQRAPVSPKVYITTPSGQVAIDLGGDAEAISFVDENGRLVRAYSIDGGQSWISRGPGMPEPSVEINVPLVERVAATGRQFVDPSGEVVFSQDANGAWQPSGEYFQANPGTRDWYGVAAWQSQKGATARLARDEMRSEFLKDQVDLMSVGAVGHRMTYTVASPSGAVNLLPPHMQAEIEREERRRQDAETARETVRGLGLPGGSRTVDFGARQRAADSRDREWADLFAPAPIYSGNIGRQLPPDTPRRFEGSGLRPMPVPKLASSIARPLPGLAAPKPVPKLASSIARPLPPVKKSTPPAVRPKVPTKAATSAAAARRAGSTVKKPAPKPAPKPTVVSKALYPSAVKAV